MKLFKKIIVVCLLLTTVLGLNTSCKKKNGSNEVSFWFWGSSAEKEVYYKLIDKYMEENPGVTIVPHHAESTVYMQQFSKETKKPDVFFMPDTEFLQWVDAGIMLNLDSYVSNEEVSQLWEDGINEYYYDMDAQTLGKSTNASLYGLPKDLGPVCLAYNKKLMDKQITANNLNKEEVYAKLNKLQAMSFTEFAELLQALTNDQKGVSKADRIYGIPYYEMDVALYSNNANYYTNGTKTQGIDDNFIDAITYIIQLATVYDVMPDADFSGSTDAYTRFLKNQSLFTWVGPWDNADFWKYGDKLDYDIIPVPYGPAVGAKSVSMIGSMCYGVSAKSKVKDQAVAFAKWLSLSTDAQTYAMELGQQVPNIKSLADEYASLEWKDQSGNVVKPESRSLYIDVIDGNNDFLGICQQNGLTDNISGKTRSLYFTYGSTWKDNFTSYLADNQMWKLSDSNQIKQLLNNYKSQLQHDLDEMNAEFKR